MESLWHLQHDKKEKIMCVVVGCRAHTEICFYDNGISPHNYRGSKSKKTGQILKCYCNWTSLKQSSHSLRLFRSSIDVTVDNNFITSSWECIPSHRKRLSLARASQLFFSPISFTVCYSCQDVQCCIKVLHIKKEEWMI